MLCHGVLLCTNVIPCYDMLSNFPRIVPITCSNTMHINKRNTNGMTWDMVYYVLQITEFPSSGGCFGTDIIRGCFKWCQMGVHRLLFGQIFAKIQYVSFEKLAKSQERQHGRQKTQTCRCCETLQVPLHNSKTYLI